MGSWWRQGTSQLRKLTHPGANRLPTSHCGSISRHRILHSLCASRSSSCLAQRRSISLATAYIRRSIHICSQKRSALCASRLARWLTGMSRMAHWWRYALTRVRSLRWSAAPISTTWRSTARSTWHWHHANQAVPSSPSSIWPPSTVPTSQAKDGGRQVQSLPTSRPSFLTVPTHPTYRSTMMAGKWG